MPRMRFGCVLVVALGLVACSEDSPMGLDGSRADLGADGGLPTDAGGDAGVDATTDGGASACVEGPPPPIEHLVVTDQGFVQGHERDGVSEFLGIPYVAPPIGARRWRSPEPFGCFDGVFDAVQFGPKCPQLEEGVFVGDEDCLQLNVWTPFVDSSARPVLVFIHGGGNALGSSGQETAGGVLYRGDRLAGVNDVVVVTLDYRLGQLGWLVNEALEPMPGRSGNYGLLDLIAGLEWVQRNIAAFGGDPDRVMVFGESAGAVNTCMLVASPLSEGLFSAALMQSGGCPGYSRAQVEGESNAMVADSGCAGAADVAACLRGLDAETVVRSHPADIQVAGRSTLYQPHVDGYVLPEAPLLAIEAGRHRDVSFVIGANSDETSRSVPPIQTEQEYEAAINALFGPVLGAEVLAQYPASSYPTPRAAFVRLTTDAKFVCPSRALARAAAEAPGISSPAYRYVFSHALDNGPLGALGAWHGLELTLVFGALELANYVPSADERALSASMQAFWSSVPRDGTPSAPGEVAWEEYRAADDNFMRFEGGAIGMESGFREEDCDFWDAWTSRLGG